MKKRHPTIPDHASVVIIGGGIIGCSIAYHLGHLGCKDVVLLERDKLTSGTTWHAAGLMVTFGSLSETATRMCLYGRHFYQRLEAETGLSTGFTPIGFIEAAANRDRLEEYRRIAAFNRYCGIDVHEISPGQIKQLFPLANVDDLLAGFYVKEDGRVNPVDATMAMVRGARQQGVRMIEGVPVTGVCRKNGSVAGVHTPYGDITAEAVVNCAGIWARQLGEADGVTIPSQSAEHYYLITEPIDHLPPNMPILEDPSHYGYFREEVGGLMVGLFEPVCAPWKIDRVPETFTFGEIEPDWDRMGPFLERALLRVPIIQHVGIKTFFCGPESFTPDLAAIIGEAPELKKYFVCTGLNSVGIIMGPGLGQMMAHWIVTGKPDVDITGVNIDRLHPYQNNPDYRRHRTVEALGMVYQCHYPYRSMTTARGAKRSAVHDRLKDRGAFFRDVSGWEGADWFAPAGGQATIETHAWGKTQWFAYWAAEHRAARDNVILMDMSFMAKFLVQGRDAGKVLNSISANDVDQAPNRTTYTPWLNEDGTLEADLTVTKLGDETFLVVVTDTMHRHAETWLKRHIPGDAHAFVTDVTSAFALLNIQGPKSRALLQSITAANLSNDAFPFRHAEPIAIGYGRTICIRMTYVGELGYELYIPTEQAVHVYDAIVEAGNAFNLTHAGLKALGSLRMEKGYRDYGHDMDNTDDPYETGLGFAVKLDKPEGFIGKAACIRKHGEAVAKRRLAQVLVKDPEPLLYHAEVVTRNAVNAGYVRSGSYGHTLGGAVGLFMIEADQPVDDTYIAGGEWQINIAGTIYPAQVSLTPLYDPERVKINA